MSKKPLLAIIAASDELQASFSNALNDSFNLDFFKSMSLFIETIENGSRNYSLIVSDAGLQSIDCMAFGQPLKVHLKQAGVPFILLEDKITDELKSKCRMACISDIALKPVDFNRLKTIIACEIGLTKCKEIPKELKSYQLPTNKRIFDIVVSGLALILLFPLFLIVGILAAAISKSSPFVGSKRVGMGAKAIKIWQFRTTYKDANKRRDQGKHKLSINNEYKSFDERALLLNKKCPECEAKNIPCQKPLCFDDGFVCEKLLQMQKKSSEKVMINESAINPLGRFIKKLKIESLPQFWNVLMGDMSIVGNDPVTVCEFNQLTFNENAMRFFAPAGMLSLWQVMKPRNGKLSEEERLAYERDYAARAETGGLVLYDILLIMKWIMSSLVRRLSSQSGERQ